jgi:hypothetical protein
MESVGGCVSTFITAEAIAEVSPYEESAQKFREFVPSGKGHEQFNEDELPLQSIPWVPLSMPVMT